jgi:conserved hypothetical protein
MDIRLTTEEFIKKARSVHGDRYDYSKVEYKGNKVRVTIICKEHGEFTQTPSKHYMKRGCPICSRYSHIKNPIHVVFSTKDFIEKARSVHGDKYDYSKVEYKNNRIQVEIICPVHGSFFQKPYSHLKGCGCFPCSRNRANDMMRHSTEGFIKKAREIHGDRYDYSKVKYTKNNRNVTIICKEHGEFQQTPYSHLKSNGCNKCTFRNLGVSQRSNTEDFIQKAKEIHGDRYDYSLVEYTKNDSKVTIICPVHGEFQQTPKLHIQGSICYKCTYNTSKMEIEFADFIKTFYSGEVITNSRSIIYPYELDIFLPEFNLGIEINGMYWHSEKFKEKKVHLNKYNLCKEKDIRLVSIWEWEIVKDKEKIKNFIKNIIIKKTKLGARKLKIKEVSIKEQREFLNDNHLQGYVSCSLALGLYFKDELIQLMTLRAKDKKNKIFEIGRLATKIGYSVIGGSEKLFKHLLSYVDYTEIISYNNMDKFTGEVYERLGLTFENITIPYGWIKNNVYLPRYATQKSKLIQKGFDKNKSESEIMRDEGFSKIYLTGVQKFILKK